MQTEKFYEKCDQYWWTHFAFVSNYIGDGNCMQWGQFIAADMQLFMLLPIILLIYQCHTSTGIFILIMFIILGAVTTGIVILLQDFLPAYLWPFDTKISSQYTFLTYTHVDSFSVGILMGIVYHKIHWYNNHATKQEKKRQTCLNWLYLTNVAPFILWFTSFIFGLLFLVL